MQLIQRLFQSNSKEHHGGWLGGATRRQRYLKRASLFIVVLVVMLLLLVQKPEVDDVLEKADVLDLSSYTEDDYWREVTNWETSWFHPVWGRIAFTVTEMLWHVPLLERIVQSVGNFFGLLFVGLARSGQMGGSLAVVRIAFGGHWTARMHHAWYHFDRPLAHAMIAQFGGSSENTRSVIDVGCGLGKFLGEFQRAGKCSDACHGVEPADMSEYWPEGVTQIKTNIFDDDSSSASESVFLKQYDLVLNLEMAEHIPVSWHPRLFDFLCNHAKKYIVFSAASPFQFGSGHISQRPLWQYRAEFEARGFVEDVALSRKMRTAAKYGWFRSNLIVLRKK